MENTKNCDCLIPVGALKKPVIIPVLINSNKKRDLISNSCSHYEPDTGKFRDLCIKCAYKFLVSKGFEPVVKDIRRCKEQIQGYSLPAVKKAKIIKFLKDNRLFEEFVNVHWKCALGEDGRKKIKYYKGIIEQYLFEAEIDKSFEPADETKFAFEEDLKKYLLKNLSLIEDGLKVYRTPEDIAGIEYPVDDDNKRIDILAVDKNNIPVVIELKLSKGYERVIGQCLYYKNKLKKIFNVPKVRIIIIAREISEKLIIAVSGLPDIDLFSYKLIFKLSKVQVD